MKLNQTQLNSALKASPNGLWIWRRSRLRTDYLDALESRRCKRVYMKVFDDLGFPHFWPDECSAEIVKAFNDRGISVVGWGYHFDKRVSVDVAATIKEIGKAMACGLDGYIFDVEKEVKNPQSHADLRQMLTDVRQVTGDKFVGYTSFGHPGFHSEVPWAMLDELCDIAFPQIYYELWNFDSDDDEIRRALEAHENLGLNAPILPIWSSEPGAPRPASAASLRHYLRKYPGSSIWRAPDRGQTCEAWNLDYDGSSPVFTPDVATAATELGKYSGALARGSKGVRVKRLQTILAKLGHSPGEIDSKFGPRTESAVKRFQLVMGLSPDGVVGPRTWVALGGELPGTVVTEHTEAYPVDLRERLATLAENEAARGLRWKDANSDAEKYLQPLREPMRRLGHIGTTPVFYDWCAAFVTYCTRGIGVSVPDQPDGFWATMALVESWKYWAKQNGTWFTRSQTSPARGDIVCFEWKDGDSSLDHIGIVRGVLAGGQTIETAEGNRGNRSVNGTRSIDSVAGIIRLG